ncbi:MAG TPA: response regulator [Flavobacterium sp.]|jgi:CheY-like chemotaxis protein
MKNLHVFYADDDPEDLHFLTTVAKSNGHSITIFNSGTEMLEKLKTLDEKPDLIFLDEFMPNKTGCEVMSEIKQHDTLRGIPAIMLSGSCAQHLVVAYISSGANYVVEKPNSLEDYNEMFLKVSKMDLKNYTPIATDFIK